MALQQSVISEQKNAHLGLLSKMTVSYVRSPAVSCKTNRRDG